MMGEGFKLAARGVDIPPEMLQTISQATKDSSLTRSITRGSVGRTEIAAITKAFSSLQASISRADKDTMALTQALKSNRQIESYRSILRAGGAGIPEALNKYMRSPQGKLKSMMEGKDVVSMMAKIAQNTDSEKKSLNRITSGGSGGGYAGYRSASGGKLLHAIGGGGRMGMIGAAAGEAMGGGIGAGVGYIAAKAIELAVNSPGILLDATQSLQNRYKTYGAYLNAAAQVARFGGMGAHTNLNTLGPNIVTNNSMNNRALASMAPQFANPMKFLQTAALSKVGLRTPQEIMNFVSSVAQAQSFKNYGGLSDAQYAGAFGQLQTYGMANRGGNVVSPNALAQFANVYGRVMEKSTAMAIDKAKVFEAIQQGIDVMARGGGAMYKSMPGTMISSFMSQGGMSPALRNPNQAISAMASIQQANQGVMGNPALAMANMEFIQGRPGKTFREKFATLGPAARALLKRYPNASNMMLMKQGSEAGVLNPYVGMIQQNFLKGMVPPGAGFISSSIEALYGVKQAAAQAVASRSKPYLGGSAGALPSIIAPGKLVTKGASQVLSKLNYMLLSNPGEAKAYIKTVMSSKNPDMMQAAKVLSYMNANQLTSATGNFITTPGMINMVTDMSTPSKIRLSKQGRKFQREIAAADIDPYNAIAMKDFAVNGTQSSGLINSVDMQDMANQLRGLNEALLASSANWFNGATKISDTLTQYSKNVQQFITRVAPHNRSTGR